MRGHSENGISYSENGISNSESCSENTPELSESSENGPFTPRAFFLKLGASENRKRAEYGFGGARFQTPSSVSFLGLTEFRGVSSVSSLSAYYLCDKANSPSFFRRAHRVLPLNSVRLSEFSSPKQYSQNSIPPVS